MTTEEMIDQALELPVEDRARIADQLLRSLNRSDPETDEKWLEAAKRRLDELRSGRTTPVDAESVFDNILRNHNA